MAEQEVPMVEQEQEQMPELREAFNRLRTEREEYAKFVNPIREERERLAAEIGPLEARVRELNNKLKEFQPRLAQLDNQLAALARAMGSKGIKAETGIYTDGK